MQPYRNHFTAKTHIRSLQEFVQQAPVSKQGSTFRSHPTTSATLPTTPTQDRPSMVATELWEESQGCDNSTDDGAATGRSVGGKADEAHATVSTILVEHTRLQIPWHTTDHRQGLLNDTAVSRNPRHTHRSNSSPSPVVPYNAADSRQSGLARSASYSLLRAPSTLVNKVGNAIDASFLASFEDPDVPRGRRHRRTPAFVRERWYRVTSKGAVRPEGAGARAVDGETESDRPLVV